LPPNFHAAPGRPAFPTPSATWSKFKTRGTLGTHLNEDQGVAVPFNRYEQQVDKADMDCAAELAKALDVPLAYFSPTPMT